MPELSPKIVGLMSTKLDDGLHLGGRGALQR